MEVLMDEKQMQERGYFIERFCDILAQSAWEFITDDGSISHALSFEDLRSIDDTFALKTNNLLDALIHDLLNGGIHHKASDSLKEVAHFDFIKRDVLLSMKHTTLGDLLNMKNKDTSPFSLKSAHSKPFDEAETAKAINILINAMDEVTILAVILSLKKIVAIDFAGEKAFGLSSHTTFKAFRSENENSFPIVLSMISHSLINIALKEDYHHAEINSSAITRKIVFTEMFLEHVFFELDELSVLDIIEELFLLEGGTHGR